MSDLDSVLSDDMLAGLSDAERVAVLQRAGAAFRRVEAVVVETIATGHSVEFPHAVGCRNAHELVQRALRVDAAGATRVMRAAGLVRREVSVSSGERMPARWPCMRDALLDGVVGVAGLLAATGPVEKVADRVGQAGRLAADICLAHEARGYTGDDADADADADADDTDGVGDGAGPGMTAEDLGRAAEEFAARLDPDGPEPDDKGAQHRRGITVGRVQHGLRSVKGHLLPEVAAQLEAILDAILNPKGPGAPMPGVAFRPSDSDTPESDPSVGDDGDGPDAVNTDPRAVIDGRSAAQKRHDAFAAALGVAARHRDMPTHGGAAPVVVVTVEAKDLTPHGAAGAWAGWGRARVGADGIVPAFVAAQIGCAGTIQRVLMDEGRIIGISSTDRVFSVHQRRAIIARDKECLIPGCHVPASWCEIHHVTEHARGGPTHTDNGVPLCWWHHRSLDASGWEIRMNDGVPQVRGPLWWDPHGRWRTPAHSITHHRVDCARRAPTRDRTRVSDIAASVMP